MNRDPSVETVRRTGGEAQDVYIRLRQSVLNGTIKPGEIINQVHVASQFNVSRTPVREALRMLQAEGLIEAQFQQRMRVTEVTPEEVDSVYATWILMQALGVSLTVPQITPEELQMIRATLATMNASTVDDAGDHSDWDQHHVAFHNLLVMHAGPVITSSIDTCWSRSDRARRAYMKSIPRSWIDSEEEHNATVEAYAEGAVARAVAITCRQLARIALNVITYINPGYEPRAIRNALNLAVRPDDQRRTLLREVGHRNFAIQGAARANAIPKIR